MTTEYQQYESRRFNPRRIREYRREGRLLGGVVFLLGPIIFYIVNRGAEDLAGNTVVAALMSLLLAVALSRLFVGRCTKNCLKDRNGEVLHMGDRVCVYRSGQTSGVLFCGILASYTARVGVVKDELTGQVHEVLGERLTLEA